MADNNSMDAKPSEPEIKIGDYGQRPGWGDRLAQALDKVGITKSRVSYWLGGSCGCEDRQAVLNGIGFWVERVLSGKTDNAKDHLQRILDDTPTEESQGQTGDTTGG